MRTFLGVASLLSMVAFVPSVLADPVVDTAWECEQAARPVHHQPHLRELVQHACKALDDRAPPACVLPLDLQAPCGLRSPLDDPV